MYERIKPVVVEVGPASSPRPHPARGPGLDNLKPGCGHARNGEVQRRRNDRRFPPLGVKAVESDQRATEKTPLARVGGACFQQPQRSSLRGWSPFPLWLRTFPERPIGRGITRISRPQCDKAKRGYASRVPSPSGALLAAHEKAAGGGSDPVFWRWCATGQGEVVHAKIHHLPSPFRGSLPPQ